MADRKTETSVRGWREPGVLTNMVMEKGHMVAIEVATGYARPARVSTTDVVIGINDEKRVDATGVPSGKARVKVRSDEIAWMENSLSADLIAWDDVGKDCFVVDSVTVGLTNGSNTRCRAGKIFAVREDGKVGVTFDQ